MVEGAAVPGRRMNVYMHDGGGGVFRREVSVRSNQGSLRGRSVHSERVASVIASGLSAF